MWTNETIKVCSAQRVGLGQVSTPHPGLTATTRFAVRYNFSSSMFPSRWGENLSQ